MCCLYGSFVCIVQFYFFSCKQCNGLCTMPAPMLLYFSLVSQLNTYISFFLILFAILDSGHGGQNKDLDGDEADDFESVKLFGCVKLMFHVTYVKNYR